MWTRAWRSVLVILLLAGGAGAALSGWNLSRQMAELERRQREIAGRVDGLLAALETLSEAADPAALRDPRLIERLRSETDALRPHIRSAEAGRAMQAVATSVARLQDVEARAQEHLLFGQDLMAADLMASDGRPAREAASSGLRTIRAAESDAYVIARASALDNSWTVIGAVATSWVIGLIVLARRPAAAVRDEPSSIIAREPIFSAADSMREPSIVIKPDLQMAADLCTAIGRLTSADDLPRLLQQAASVLDASGVVVWMAAGEELFAAAAFGYPPQVIRKLGPINRTAVNATAAAWRSGALQVVSGDFAERSALAAPMMGPDRCVGVLAVEIGSGQDGDQATRAVTTMLAAQLAAALAGWPAASATAPGQATPLDRAAEA